MPANILENNSVLSDGRIIYNKTIASTLEAVSEVGLEFSTIATTNFGDEVAGLLDLGLVEAMTNVVRHGYQGASDGFLSISCFCFVDFFIIKLVDAGITIPAENLKQANGDVFDFDPLDIDAIPSGGMGLSLINLVFDNISYQSKNNENTMLLVKNLTNLPG